LVLLIPAILLVFGVLGYAVYSISQILEKVNGFAEFYEVDEYGE